MSINSDQRFNYHSMGRSTYCDNKLICLSRQTIINNAADISQEYEIESNDFSDYDYPKFDDVPPGCYFSEITHAEYNSDYRGKKYIEVYYEIIPYWDCYKLAIGKKSYDDIKTYHIIQKYPINSTHYAKFTSSISTFIGKKKFKVKEAKGVTEYVGLNYMKSDIGGYYFRKPITWEDFAECCNCKEAEINDIQKNNEETAFYEQENITDKEEYDYTYDW